MANYVKMRSSQKCFRCGETIYPGEIASTGLHGLEKLRGDKYATRQFLSGKGPHFKRTWLCKACLYKEIENGDYKKDTEMVR